VELDRKTIQKREFSSSRRGYDPAEVDAHLASIADAVERLGRSSTAGTAAERVKGIIEAAERTAEEIESGARERAGTAGDEAAQAERRRDQAQAEANEQLRLAAEAAGLLEQAVAELERVGGALAELPKAAPQQAPPAAEEPLAREEAPAPEAPAAPEERSDSRAQTTVLEEPPAVEEQDEPPAVEEQDEPPAVEEQGEPAGVDAQGDPGAGGEGARLIALNMALSGTPREETARYLAENFELEDADAVLDDVYSRAGG
jgi:DivIVA domain-containing protein